MCTSDPTATSAVACLYAQKATELVSKPVQKSNTLVLTYLVLGSKDSTACEDIARTAIMLGYGPQSERRLNGRTICFMENCILCLESPETATVHWDCFRVLDTFNVPRDTLWTALAWRFPFRAVSALPFAREASSLHRYIRLPTG